MLRRSLIYCALVTLFFAVSCSAPRRSIYFQDDVHADTVIAQQSLVPVSDVVIQNDDILAINVTSSSFGQENPGRNIFNEGGTQFTLTPSAQGNTGQSQSSGYLVDKAGVIDFPVIGKTKVSGLTIRDIKEKLADTLKHYITAPVVEVRIINYKVTVLGEVGRPGTIIAPNHKINILEALATAGDIPVSGRKDNVMVIREQNGKRDFVSLNLNSRAVFSNPYFNLKQNDIIYVEASKVRRSENNEFIRLYLPIITSLITTALTVYTVSQIGK